MRPQETYEAPSSIACHSCPSCKEAHHLCANALPAGPRLDHGDLSRNGEQW